MSDAELDISVVIPVYNEAENLDKLYERLSAAMVGLKRSYEIVLVDDGSEDDSIKMLKDLSNRDSHVRAVILARNFGQHGAVSAGFAHAKGKVIVTLDADLQNPPEEIPKLIAKIDEGYDVVGGIRQHRKDSLLRKFPSFLTNKIASLVVGKRMVDCGCMLRAYRSEVIREMLDLNDTSIFIPALTASLAHHFIEVPVSHDERYRGQSKYHLFRLMMIYFDLITGYSSIPIQMISIFGLITSFFGFAFGFFLLIRRLILGPDVSQGVFTLMAILFLFMGLLFLVLGLIGEYISRIYLEIRKRPKFRMKEIYSSKK
jgi:undecaprenyl-phosphate 4-deoxy-4-formamido-L-arabinose transferase